MQHYRGFASGTGRDKPIRTLAHFKVFKSTQAVSNSNTTLSRFCSGRHKLIRTLAPFNRSHTAPTCNISGLKDAQSKFSGPITNLLPMVCVFMKILARQCENKKQTKRLKSFKFRTFIAGRFQLTSWQLKVKAFKSTQAISDSNATQSRFLSSVPDTNTDIRPFKVPERT